ncbi:ANTAR domain-containing protein [Streptomyces sp. NPDC016845]|uniref:ANTAR domain-containing protein n=1 Tax=Streptomyces sp. NPDC016845 TaxID=3364972 RepID=UPI00378A2E0D
MYLEAADVTVEPAHAPADAPEAPSSAPPAPRGRSLHSCGPGPPSPDTAQPPDGDPLQEAVVAHADVDQAKGVICLAGRLTPAETCDVLREITMRTNSKLRDSAPQIITWAHPPMRHPAAPGVAAPVPAAARPARTGQAAPRPAGLRLAPTLGGAGGGLHGDPGEGPNVLGCGSFGVTIGIRR